MVADLPGIGLILAITIVAGVIAYIGDRVGHQVGRKRLTLFGLRPKYTSTVVAVATGMLIALSVTLAALIASSVVRTAFFRIGQLNAQINQLQAQAVAQQGELQTTRNNNIAVTKASPVAQGVVIDVTIPEAQQLRLFSQFFDEAVRTANVTAARLGLQPDTLRSSDPQVQANLLHELQEARDHFGSLGDHGVPLLFLPVAPSNLFRGDRMTFIFAAWADRRLYGNNEEVASIDVEGGRPIAPQRVPAARVAGVRRARQGRLPLSVLRPPERLRSAALRGRDGGARQGEGPLPARRPLRGRPLPPHLAVRPGRLARGAALNPPAILGLDPGTRKCGYALLAGLGTKPLTQGIAPLEALAERLRELLAATPVSVAAVGRGTNAAAVAEIVRGLGLQVALVDERETTLQARARFFDDHPPRGWRRLIPRGMLLPGRPIDDYAALLIAERYLKAS